MEILLAVVVLALGVGITFILPLVAWARTHRLERQIGDLTARLASFEEVVRLIRAQDRAAIRQSLATSQSAPPAATATAPAAEAASPVSGSSQPVVAPPDGENPAAPFNAVPPSAAAVSVPGPPNELAPNVDVVPPPGEAPPRLPALPLTTASHRDDGVEAAIGGRLMLWVGTVVLVLGVAFFLKYAFENDWITESMRVGMGLTGGLALAALGHRLVGRGYRAYGQILTGGGLAVLYLSIYAAFGYYELIARTPAFVFLVIVTVAAAWLADRQNAVGLALMGVGGGFATPFLVGGGTDAQVTLFSYDALLVVGTLYLAARRGWPVLNLVSFFATWLTVGAWAGEYYRPDKWQRTEAFLTLFCALFLGILIAQLRRHGWKHPVSLALAIGPLLYHVCSLAVLFGHGAAPLVYLIAVTLVAVAWATRAEAPRWRVVAWGAVIPPLLTWLGSHSSQHWLIANLVAAGGIYALHALAQLDVVFRHERKLSRLDAALMHLNGYALVAGIYLALENVALAWAPTAALLVGVLHASLAWLLRSVDRTAALHGLAVALGAATIAAALRLDGPWLTMALAIEGGLVIWLGLELKEGWFRAAAAGLLVTAVLRYGSLSLPVKPAVFTLFRDEAFAMGAAIAAVLLAVAWLYRRYGTANFPENRTALVVSVIGACLMLVVALSAENETYWTLRSDQLPDATFASSLTLSAIWTLSAALFIAIGFWKEFAPLRFLAIGLFGLTVVKVFAVDLSDLAGIYRVLGFMGLGAVLVVVSFLYQRARKKTPSAPAAPPESGAAPGA